MPDAPESGHQLPRQGRALRPARLAWPRHIGTQWKREALFAQAMQVLAKATLAAVDNRAPMAAGRLTGLAYTLQNGELRERVREVTESSYAAGAEWLRGFDPAELPMPPEQLVRVLHALMEGLVLQRILTPELCTEEIFYAAFAQFGRGQRS